MMHKQVDSARDLRLDISPLRLLHSANHDFGSSGYLGKDNEQETLLDATTNSGVKSKVPTLSASTAGNRHISRRRFNVKGSDKSTNSRNTGAGENIGSYSALGITGSPGSLNTSKEMKPLQLQSGNIATKHSAQDSHTKSSALHGKKKSKEDLDEILRKRLEKLEAKLEVIGSEYSAPGPEISDEDIAKERGMGDGRQIVTASSRAKKKRKANDKQSSGKHSKRRHTTDDDTDRIIAANINGNLTATSDKMDRYISTLLKNETNASEEFLSMSADFSDQIMSVIQSHVGDHSVNAEFGNLLSSSDTENLVDTETVMLNVLSQNQSDVSSGRHCADASNTEVNPIDMLSQGIDIDAAILSCQDSDVKAETKENITEHLEETNRIGCLSVDTQWDSQFVESSAVKCTHLSSVQDWRKKKLLDMLISGQLKEIPIGTLSELRNEGTDKLVAISLQNILSSLSWLWSVAVGDNMMDSVQEVVSNTANNLDSLVIDFVENSGCVDIPLTMSLYGDQMNDDAVNPEHAANQDMSDEGDWSHEELLLLKGLAAGLDDARENILNQGKYSVTDIAEATAVGFASVPEHVVNLHKKTHSDIADDLYSPTRPTEVELIASDDIKNVKKLKDLPQSNDKNEMTGLYSADVSSTVNDLVENFAPTRRTVRIHKKENAAEKKLTERTKGAHKARRYRSTSKHKESSRFEEDLGNIGSQISDAGFSYDELSIGMGRGHSLSVSEEFLMNKSAEFATDGAPPSQESVDKQTGDIKSDDTFRDFDLAFENQYREQSKSMPVASHKEKSSKKHSADRDEISEKSHDSGSDEKKAIRSRKHKEHHADVIDRKNKKQSCDIDQQLKLDVRSEIEDVSARIESLLYETYGVTVGNAASISDEVAIHVGDKHFPDLSGLSFDEKVALMSGENQVDNAVKAMCSTALLNDCLTELNIPMSMVNISFPQNAVAHLSDTLPAMKMASESSQAKKSLIVSPSNPALESNQTRKSVLVSPNSPPPLKSKQSSVVRRNKSTEETIIPQRRQQAAVTETEKRLMKADKLMQTFRRSQIAKRQSQKASPQPTAAFLKQVQTVAKSEETVGEFEGENPDESNAVESQTGVTASDPDFTTVITDGNILASVELPPQDLPKPFPQNAAASSSDGLPVDVALHALSSEIMQAPETELFTNETPTAALAPLSEPQDLAEPVCVSTTSSEIPAVPLSGITKSKSTENGTVTTITAAGKECRVFVFNTDNPLSHEVEEALKSLNGTSTFDPYNVVLLRAYNQLECRVLIHTSDVEHIHRIPNLLRLKRDLRVSFLVYDRVEDVRSRNWKCVFPRGGLAIMDTGTLIGCSSDILVSMCEFMLKQTKERNVPWQLMISSNTLPELHRLRATEADSAVDYSRKAAIIAQFQASGVITTLPEEFSRQSRRRLSVEDYLQAFAIVQSQFISKHRHLLFVSGMSRTDHDASSFVSRGVDMMSVSDFVRGFVGQSISSQLPPHHEYAVEQTSGTYCDVILSNGAESIMNKWISPTVVSASS